MRILNGVNILVRGFVSFLLLKSVSDKKSSISTCLLFQRSRFHAVRIGLATEIDTAAHNSVIRTRDIRGWWCYVNTYIALTNANRERWFHVRFHCHHLEWLKNWVWYFWNSVWNVVYEVLWCFFSCGCFFSFSSPRIWHFGWSFVEHRATRHLLLININVTFGINIFNVQRHVWFFVEVFSRIDSHFIELVRSSK